MNSGRFGGDVDCGRLEGRLRLGCEDGRLDNSDCGMRGDCMGRKEAEVGDFLGENGLLGVVSSGIVGSCC